MIGEAHVAVLAARHPSADAAFYHRRKAASVLKEDNLPCTMAEATREKLAWIRDSGIKDRFPKGEVGRTWQAVLAGWGVNET